jgi:hypothetical protein
MGNFPINNVKKLLALPDTQRSSHIALAVQQHLHPTLHSAYAAAICLQRAADTAAHAPKKHINH